jgi:hypothetical protein
MFEMSRSNYWHIAMTFGLVLFRAVRFFFGWAACLDSSSPPLLFFARFCDLFFVSAAVDLVKSPAVMATSSS